MSRKFKIEPYVLVCLKNNSNPHGRPVEVVSYPDESGKTFVRMVPGVAGSAEWVETSELSDGFCGRGYKVNHIFKALPMHKFSGSFPDDMIRYIGTGGVIEIPSEDKGLISLNPGETLCFHLGRSKKGAEDVVRARWESFGWTTRPINTFKIVPFRTV